jgi:hypothetical protein
VTARRVLLDGLARDADMVEVLSLEGLRERFLPEAAFRGRQNAKLQYAVLAAAAIHGGTEPDLLEEVAFWQADDFWQCAAYAAVAYIRAAASRAGVPVRQTCQELNKRPGLPSPCRIFVVGRRAGPACGLAQIIPVCAARLPMVPMPPTVPNGGSHTRISGRRWRQRSTVHAWPQLPARRGRSVAEPIGDLRL